MTTYQGEQEVAAAAEFEQLAGGFEEDEQLPEFLRELLIGRPAECEVARAVRIDAARGILADLRFDAPELVEYVRAMPGLAPLTTCSNQQLRAGGETPV
ncbi:hypothetical protein P3T36_004691 [Kitasatospora sp. MAP12-15]|uniref:hypothetical protein n=1 Tax=unclassified Kitasatospora TaxID=2633591 RepID=UPI0024768F2E|nr:hypothetical protein [Kitasatospora sp. MAP12-44]MDH6111537.1 hypothetical protein [Kitasatospora sp. MAP12-44]